MVTRIGPWLALVSVVALLAAGLVMFIPVTAVGQQETSAVTRTQDLDKGYSNTETKQYKGTVTVSQTSGLVRQRVKVSWSGFKPTGTGGSSAAPYPVVVMQCWGKSTEVTQQTCWNGGTNMGTQVLNAAALIEPFPYAGDIFGPTPAANAVKSVVPFKARDDGKLYSGTQDDTGWPAGAVVKANPPAFSETTKNAIMPNNYMGITNADGTGEVDIELLTAFENPHLGCSSTAACSLVVIPVGDPTCKNDAELPANRRGQCAKPQAVLRNAATWATQTNWARKFVFDLSFRESAASCQLDERQETGLAGSFYAYQLLNNSWRPKFCHDESLFRLGYTALSDGESRAQYMAALGGEWQDGTTNALLTSRAIEGEPAKPTVYAPVTITSVAVSFVLDDEKGREVTELKLNARLLAKMLTQSYRTMAGSGVNHPALRTNPEWWGSDPEFLALNPGLTAAMQSRIGREASAYPVISLGDLDAIHALTSYIAADKDAVAWLGGANDGYGMVVNPQFHNYKLPVGLLELRDDYVVTDNNLFKGQILLSQYANVADNLYSAAIAATQAWPYANISQSCTGPVNEQICTLKRVDQRQIGGQRAVLAITTLADSRVFGLRQAALQTTPGKFVKPDDVAVALALRGTTLDEKTGVLTSDIPAMHPNAYPGMSIVYAAIPTSGLSAGTAGNYAKFLDYAAGPGQAAGQEAGQLPTGYVPLSDPLREQTRNAAVAVREQKGVVPAPPPGLSEDPAAGLLPPGESGASSGLLGSGGGGVAGGNGAGAAAGAASNATTPPSSPTAPPTVDKQATSVATRSDSSGFAKWVLPGLLGIGALAGLIAFGAMVWTQPDHPVRRWLRRLRTR
ncbi:hypothetical protein KIPE111705_35735 [Kibdelosporangium persicum]|uniref:PBP domain-containing protein n=1 Tax=Kibdelosporangium persicum TaxID=2698649 RepID=A0ABX2F933_9PSEU|nr:hypothetical protein [Kibdelosporangium persicum]NRN67868.1 hypothetical protein [Kibdelosporangium persicum]